MDHGIGHTIPPGVLYSISLYQAALRHPRSCQWKTRAMLERRRFRPMRHWVCFACRKQFRKPLRLQNPEAEEQRAVETSSPCPGCGEPLVDMGQYFRPPARADGRAWNEWRQIAEHGTRLNTEGSVAWTDFVLRHTTGKLSARAIIRNCPYQVRSHGELLPHNIEWRYGRRRR